MTAGESAARAAVASSTLAAAHRRDHLGRAQCCEPHCVEVVHLGNKAAMVCHDCGADSGFVEGHLAIGLSHEHIERTGPGAAA